MSRQLNQAQIGRNTTIITHEAASVTHHPVTRHAPASYIVSRNLTDKKVLRVSLVQFEKNYGSPTLCVKLFAHFWWREA